MSSTSAPARTGIDLAKVSGGGVSARTRLEALKYLPALRQRLIEAWNDQDVERVVACYTDDLIYVDPNTRGAVEGLEDFSHYLMKLFSRWQMHWSVKETFPLVDTDGAAGLWRASFRVAGSEQSVEVEGMDLVLIENGPLKRNEIYFDRVSHQKRSFRARSCFRPKRLSHEATRWLSRVA